MHISKITLLHGHELTISAQRQARIVQAKLGAVDYSDRNQVEKARNAITHMGLWDSITDWFQGGTKSAALKAAATMILCSHAADWERDSPGRKALASLSTQKWLEAQNSLFTVLSPAAALAMYDCKHHLVTMLANNELETVQEKYRIISMGIVYKPDTKTPVDDLMPMLLTFGEALHDPEIARHPQAMSSVAALQDTKVTSPSPAAPVSSTNKGVNHRQSDDEGDFFLRYLAKVAEKGVDDDGSSASAESIHNDDVLYQYLAETHTRQVNRPRADLSSVNIQGDD